MTQSGFDAGAIAGIGFGLGSVVFVGLVLVLVRYRNKRVDARIQSQSDKKIDDTQEKMTNNLQQQPVSTPPEHDELSDERRWD